MTVDLSSKRYFRRRVVSIRVSKISVQPKGKYKPVSLKPVELEILSLKRAIVSIQIEDSAKKAEIRGVLEYKGRALIMTRTSGICNTAEIVRFLGAFYHQRYNTYGIRGLSLRDSDRVCDCTVVNPENVLGFLHLIKDNGGLTVTSRSSGELPLRYGTDETFALGKNEDSPDSAVAGGDARGDVIINPRAKPVEKQEHLPESTKPGTTVLVDEAVVVQPKDIKEYKIVLKKGQLVTIEAGAEYPITVELISQTAILKSDKRHLKTIDVERSRTEVRNANIEFEARRNGTWFVHVHNDQRKLPLEVGVIISIE